MFCKFFATPIACLFSVALFAQTVNNRLAEKLLHDMENTSDSATLWRMGSQALELFNKSNQSEKGAEILCRYGKFLYALTEYDKAERYFKKALTIAQTHHNDTLINRIHIYLGFINSFGGDKKKSYELFESALIKAERHCDTTAMIDALNGMAEMKENQYKREKAMEKYLQALSLAKKINKSYETAIILNNLAGLKFDNDQLEEAKTDYLQALGLAKSIQQDYLQSIIYNGIGNCYAKTNKTDSAIYYYRLFLSFAQKTKQSKNASVAFLNIAYSYFEKQDFKYALIYADSSLQIAEEKNIDLAKFPAMMCKADIFLEKGDIKQAIKYADQAIQIANEMKSYQGLAACHELKSELYARIKDYKNAYEQQQLYRKYSDSITNSDVKKKMAELEIQYEVEQKENELLKEQQKVQLLEQENKTKEARQQLIILLSITIIASLCIGIYIYSIRLSKKNQEIFSEKLIQATESERNRIAKDLHDDIGASLSVVKNKLYMHAAQQPYYEEIDRDLGTIMEHTRSIAHELYPAYIEKTGLKSILLEFMSRIEKDSGIICATDIQDIDSQLSIDEKAHIFRIVQECVNNTLKHAQASAIKLIITHDKKSIQMIYQDNGIGMDISKSSDGIGIMSIKERTRILHGNFTLKSSKEKGIKLVFTFRSKKELA